MPCNVTQELRDSHQHLVAGVVTVGVVNLFEVVDVKQQYRHVMIMATASGEVLLGLGVEHAPVLETGQRVRGRLFRQGDFAHFQLMNGACKAVVYVHARLHLERINRFIEEIIRPVQKREMFLGIVFGGGHDDHWQITDAGILRLTD